MNKKSLSGFAGQILYVNLTKGHIEKKDLDIEFARQNIGGLGFSTKIFLDLIKDQPDFDALSAENPFILMTGPLTGMLLNGAAKWTVCAKSPLTGFWGDSNIGGHFGARLKCAGYDGIVITGASDHPVYIFIDNDKVELRDAKKYWGQDVYTANRTILDDLKNQSSGKGQVLAIGPAGENLVKFASLVNKGHVAGRTGMGAVWGSKNLKAIYVSGTGKIHPARPEKLKEIVRELRQIYDESIFIAAMKSIGTASQMDVGILSGDIPIKNWQMTEWEEIDELGPATIEEKILAGHKSCFGCGVGCKKEVQVKHGPFQMDKGPGPEYEAIAAFGTMCLNSSIESVAKANEICNCLGMDSISCGSVIAFAIECFEHGLITETDTKGLDLTWGNSMTIVKLTEMIGKREGIGNILAEGSAKAAKYFCPKAKDHLATIKGLEVPMHDPRSAHGYGLAYAVAPRGGCHQASLTFEIESGSMIVPEIPELFNELPEGSEGRAELNVAAQDYGMFFSNCAIFCNLGASPLNATQAVSIINCVTGFDYNLDDVLNIGKRVWYLKRGLTNLFGARACDDRLPLKLMTPMNDGPTAGNIPDMKMMLEQFYEMRGIDKNGIPRNDILIDLGLTDLASLLKERTS